MVQSRLGYFQKADSENGMMEKTDFDIVMLALPRWDGPYSSTAYSLAKALSKHTRVFYIDNPVTAKEWIVKRNNPEMIRRKEALFFGSNMISRADEQYPNLIAVTPRMMLPINWLPSGNTYEELSKINDRIFDACINKLISLFHIKRYVFINSFNPLFARRRHWKLTPVLTVYQSVDAIGQAPYMNKHGVRLEREWVENADLTITTSSQLKRSLGQWKDTVYLLPNAADVKLFQRAKTMTFERPAELAGIARDKKIIIYTGNICQRLDYELLKKVAQKHRDKILLMVGPFARNDYQSSGLSALPNVIFTGKKKIHELPAYLQHADCCIIPFLSNSATASIYPLKINEYLSAGKPVVTTDFSEDIRAFSDIAYVSSSSDDLVTKIDQAIVEDNDFLQDRRVSYASSNNWEARAHRFIALCLEFISHGRGARPFERRTRADIVNEPGV